MGAGFVRGTWGLFALWLPLAAACGSGGSAGSVPSGGSLNCDSACTKVASLGCPKTQDHVTCVNSCTADLGSYQNQCGSVLSNYFDCALQHLVCGSDGEANVTPGTCTSEVTQLEVCTACIVSSTASACSKCTHTTCCAERRAMVSDPNAAALDTCLQACTDTTCETACQAQYPSVQAGIKAYDDCTSTQCASACSTTGP